MEPADFCFWLQGFIESRVISDPTSTSLSSKQVEVIKAKLDSTMKLIEEVQKDMRQYEKVEEPEDDEEEFDEDSETWKKR